MAVWQPSDLWQGTAIQQALQEQGIPCHLAGASRAGLTAMHPSTVLPPQIMVRRKDAERAVAFIQEHDWPSYTPPKRKK